MNGERHGREPALLVSQQWFLSWEAAPGTIQLLVRDWTWKMGKQCLVLKHREKVDSRAPARGQLRSALLL